MKNFVTPFAATAIVQLANLASGVLAARFLLPEGRGELAAVILLPALVVSLGGISVNVAAAFFAARERDRTGEVFAASTILATGLSAVLVVIGLAIVPLAYRHYSPEVRDLTRFYLAFVPINLIGMCYMAILQGRLNVTLFNALRALMPVAYVGLILLAALWMKRADVAGFTAAFLGASAIVTASAAAIMALSGWVRLRAPFSLIRSMLRYGAGVHAGYVIAIAGQKLDQLLIALWLAPSELGLYAVALAAGGVVNLVGSTIDLIVFPKVAAAGDSATRAVTLGRYSRAATSLAALAAVVLVPFLPWLIELFFGHAFRQASEAARILALGAIPFALKVTLYAGLRGAGLPLSVARVEAVSLAALAAALTVLLPRFAIAGAAWSVVIANMLGCALAAAKIRREFGIGPASLLVPTNDDWRRLGGALGRARS